MSPKFGTSGLRGLVTDLTDDLVGMYVRAFIAACPTGGAVHVGRDLRPSSPAIADAVLRAVEAAGLQAIDHGELPTPALALASISAGQGAVMVTGSHIPADRNGLKFYVPGGELDKAGEQAIAALLSDAPAQAQVPPPRQVSRRAVQAYIDRSVTAFEPGALSGLRIGIYQHSSVARDVMVEVVTGLGAEAVPLARSDVFIPVDTEAVDPGTRDQLATWAAEFGLDAILSTDGDGDRPMVAGADGAIVPGDILGPITATVLGADRIVTPVSSNSLIDGMPHFIERRRTRIGSPFVIAGMEEILRETPAAAVAGYEANGGFLLGFNATASAGMIAPLMTRDSLLPMIVPLVAAHRRGLKLTDLLAELPQCFTASDRVQDIATEKSAALIATLSRDTAARATFFDDVGEEVSVDLTDGLRVTFEGGTIVHLRPSGNAPECRCYVEAATAARARSLVESYINKLRATLG